MPSKKKKWPRAELMMGAGILCMVLAIVIPGWWRYNTQRRMALTRSDLNAMVTAGERFFLEYGQWPSPHMGQPDDQSYGRDTPNYHVMNILLAVDGPGNEGHRLNPNRIVFIRLPPYRRGVSGISEDGEFLDCWGQSYQIAIDTDLNNTVTMSQSIYRNQVGKGMVIWSYGPDRRSDTNQDILSWME